MPRTSTKKDKTIYQKLREEMGLTREKASELLGSIPPERIERIESGRYMAHPDEVTLMAEKYRAPQLCNYYCAHECEIGKQYVPEIKIKDLTQIVLEMLASLNAVKKQQDRFIEIAADGVIDADEISDFVAIEEQLERISMTVDTLQLWIEQKLASGMIDTDLYNQIRARNRNNS